MKKKAETKKTKKPKYWRSRPVESMSNEGVARAVAKGLSNLVEHFLGIEFYNENGPDVFPSQGSKSITLRYEAHNLDMNEIDLLSKLRNLYHSSPEDGSPSVDVNIYARSSTDEYHKNHSWLKKQDPKEWKEVLKYEYDGLFDIEIEFWFTENDWKKYGGYIEKKAKE